ncbi:MAG: DUF429 domain-containing protein [Candidatus Kapaibacteriota bacterium]
MWERMVFGLDLSAKDVNPTGVCFLSGKFARTKVLKSDNEILEEIQVSNPNIIAIDAPLTLNNRICDVLLKKYGAMPLKLKSIMQLATRAVRLVNELETLILQDTKIIEVFPTATAKILSVYHRDDGIKQQKIAEVLNIEFNCKVSKDELDAFLCALTGWLFSANLTIDVGNEQGKITIPNVAKVDEIIRMVQNLKIEVGKLK